MEKWSKTSTDICMATADCETSKQKQYSGVSEVALAYLMSRIKIHAFVRVLHIALLDQLLQTIKLGVH